TGKLMRAFQSAASIKITGPEVGARRSGLENIAASEAVEIVRKVNIELAIEACRQALRHRLGGHEKYMRVHLAVRSLEDVSGILGQLSAALELMKPLQYSGDQRSFAILVRAPPP